MAAKSRERNQTFGIGLRVGAAVTFLLVAALVAGAAHADGFGGKGPLSNLIKFDENHYHIDYADWISTEVISTGSVRKIEYGRVTDVNIVTTASGTYSDDALASPHVLYPGIEVTRTVHGNALGPSFGFIHAGMPGTSIHRISRGINGGYVYTRTNAFGSRGCVSSPDIRTCTSF